MHLHSDGNHGDRPGPRRPSRRATSPVTAGFLSLRRLRVARALGTGTIRIGLAFLLALFGTFSSFPSRPRRSSRW